MTTNDCSGIMEKSKQVDIFAPSCSAVQKRQTMDRSGRSLCWASALVTISFHKGPNRHTKWPYLVWHEEVPAQDLELTMSAHNVVSSKINNVFGFIFTHATQVFVKLYTLQTRNIPISLSIIIFKNNKSIPECRSDYFSNISFYSSSKHLSIITWRISYHLHCKFSYAVCFKIVESTKGRRH